ncbi:MAG: hypothetical protein QOE70_4611 [Chthoniobacter sp.]|nr:hypothetical protein [Chthoniobacter sp.]
MRAPSQVPPQLPARSPRRQNSLRAFSLIEITLAIGIVAFAFVALFGLLPVGLNVFRGALDTSVRSQIVQRLVADAQQADFDVLKSKGDSFRYFDDEGTEIEAGKSIYTASLTAKSPSALPQSAVSLNLITLAIKIAKNPGHVANPFALESKLPFTSHVAFVARNK